MSKFVLTPFSKLLCSFIFLIAIFSSSSCRAYNVVNFGAQGDGRTDSTSAFLRTWMAACSSVKPSSVIVPRGRFLIRNVAFTGPCRNRITFQFRGTLVAPDNYNVIGNNLFWIAFHKVSGLRVIGGSIDARGNSFWRCRRSGGGCPAGARSMSFEWCNNVVLSGLKSYNSQMIHITVGHSSNVRIQNVRITAPSGSPNTDGIHVQSSRGITISGATIRTGDDCISIGPGAMNVWVEKVGCGPGHGISVGSLGNSFNEDGVQNVTVANSVFTKTQNGVRVKSWARPSAGFAKNLNFRDLVMRSVGNPIIIDQKYCPNNQCPTQSSGIQVSGVTYRNIKGTSTTQAAMSFKCSSSNPCTGIKLQDINLTSVNRQNRPTTAYCENARGSTAGTVFPRSCL